MRRIGADGSVTPVRAILGTSPWPEHFTIIGYGPEDGPDAMQPWPAGTYRLELGIDPGAVTPDDRDRHRRGGGRAVGGPVGDSGCDPRPPRRLRTAP